MTEDAHLAGDVEGDDVALHPWTGARGHAEATLPGRHMPAEQAAGAQDARWVQSRSSHSHIVVTSVDPHTARRFDDPARLLEVREHIGPFADRRSAERWARGHYADKPSVAWTTAQVRGPAWVEEDERRLRKGPGAPPD